MTRPRKQTVDYFPHSCDHGQTMFILEDRYGNNGYAFWFKLLELLGKTAGHSLDCNNPATWEFLQARTHLGADVCNEILDLLAKLGAIDSDLWESRLVWSDNFVIGVADAYRNRLSEIPIRPDNLRQKPPEPPQPNAENPQTKLKETKEKKSRKDIAPPGPSDTVGAVLFFSCAYFDVNLDYRFKLAKEYPALNDDLLRKELSKMEDWISDNASKKKFKANGHLANPKLFIKNWLDRVGGIFGPGSDKPKGFGAVKRFMEKGGPNG